MADRNQKYEQVFVDIDRRVYDEAFKLANEKGQTLSEFMRNWITAACQNGFPETKGLDLKPDNSTQLRLRVPEKIRDALHKEVNRLEETGRRTSVNQLVRTWARQKFSPHS